MISARIYPKLADFRRGLHPSTPPRRQPDCFEAKVQFQCLAQISSQSAKGINHARPKIEAGDSSESRDISILTFALLNSSHKLLESKTNEE
jgi:hypothetical protein